MDILSVINKFNTQEKCIEFLELKRWKNKITCPYCASDNIYKHRNFKQNYYCGGCRNCFSVTVKSTFHDTKIPLQKWFLAITMFLDAKKGISAKQLERNLDVNYKTAWRMLHKIREAMGDNEQRELFTGILETDETYIGGKPKKNKDNAPQKKAEEQ